MTTVFDYRQLLSLDGLKPEQVTVVARSGFSDDGVVELAYHNIPSGAIIGASKWLRENRLVLSDVLVGQTRLDGVWRTIAIEERVSKSGVGNVGGTIVQRFAKGYYTHLDWTAARVRAVTSFRQNDVSHAQSAEIASSPWAEIVEAVFPHVDSVAAERIVSESRLETVSDVDLSSGTRLDGVWFVLRMAGERQDDGTSNIVLMLARMKYVVRAFDGKGTPEQAAIYYIQGVPRQNAQAVIDEWLRIGGDGAGARLSGSQESLGLVDITLTTYDAEQSAGAGIETDKQETYFVVREGETSACLSHPAVYPAFQGGKIVEIVNRKTADGKYRVSVITTTAKTGETPEYTQSVTHSGVTILRRSARSLNPNNLPGWAIPPSGPPQTGVGLILNRQMNEFGQYSAELVKKVAEYVKLPDGVGAYEVVDDRFIDFHGVRPENLNAVLSTFNDLSPTHKIYLSGLSFDDDTGTYSGRLYADKRDGAYGSGRGAYKECTITWDERGVMYHTVNTDGVPKLYYSTVNYSCGRRQARNESDIQSWLAAGGPHDNVRVGPLGGWGFFAEYKDAEISSITQWYPVNE